MTEQEQIQAIYDAYPRKVGRRAALKAIENAVKRLMKGPGKFPDADEHQARRYLYKRAAEYALSPAGKKPSDPAQDFRPHPATWMNQERYFDDPAEWQKPNGGSGNATKSSSGAAKAGRTIDAAKAAIERIENRHRPGTTGNNEGRRVQPEDAGDLCGRTIDGTV